VHVTGTDGDTKIDTGFYTGSDGMSLRPVRALVLLHSICSRGYKWPVTNCGLVLRLDGHHVLDVDFRRSG